MYVWMYVCMYVYVCVNVFMYVYVCIHVYIYVQVQKFGDKALIQDPKFKVKASICPFAQTML